MRIAFVGASGVGKSRLVDYLQPKLDLPLNPVGSRSVAKALGFDNAYDVDRYNLRNTFQRRLFSEKTYWEKGHDDFITDRTVFDNLAYSIHHGGAENIDEEELNAYVAAMKRYTHVIYLPLYRFQKLGTDPARNTSPVYHKMFDMVVRSLLSEYDIEHVALHCPVEDRLPILRGMFHLDP